MIGNGSDFQGLAGLSWPSEPRIELPIHRHCSPPLSSGSWSSSGMPTRKLGRKTLLIQLLFGQDLVSQNCENEQRKDHATVEPSERDRAIGDIATLDECIFSADGYLTAPTVKPAMKRSRNRLYMNAMGRLAIKQAAISAPQ